MKQIILWLIAIFILSGCNSKVTDNQNSNIPKASHGYYVDSPVIGVDYICGNVQGKTAESGEFKFYQGDSCKFSIGDVKLREVDANSLYDGVTIFEDNLPVARVLQTLDRDGDADKKGIELTNSSAKCLKKSFNKNYIPNRVTDSDIENLYNCLKADSSYNGKAISQSEAKAHIEKSKGNKDTTAPIITLNGANPLILKVGESYTELGATATDNIDGNISVEISGSIDTSRVGEYNITYKATDSSGNSASVTRVVKVILETDTTPPVITLNGDNPIVLKKGETYSEPGAVAVDDKDGNVEVTISGSVDINRVGEYNVTYTAVDSAGNEAKAVRVVKVVANSSDDTTPPEITLNGDNPMEITLGESYSEPGAKAVDDKDGNIKVAIEGSVDSNTLGTYKILYKAVDSAGNEANATRVVKVVDTLKDAPGVDIAYKFGKATQGTDIYYTYYQPPYYAIDNNDSTYNNTNSGEDGKNWLQIELPHPTEIAKIVLQNRDKFANHLKGAKVYISDTPYSGSLEDKKEIATIEATNDEQVFTFNPPLRANYLLIKGASIKGEKHNIHFRKVEVYGALPLAPAFEKENYYFLIANATKVGTTIGSVKAVDYQEGKISYTILGDVPFSIDSSGNLAVNGKIDSGVYNFEVEADDGEYKRKVAVTVEVTAKDAIEQLLKSGDILHSKVTKQELIDATLSEIEKTKGFLKDAKVQIFNLNSDVTAKDDGSSLTSLDWSLTRAGAIFSPMLGKNTPLLYTNATNGGKKIEHLPAAIIGTKGAGRYAVFGANPFVNKSNEQMQKVLENTLLWVSKKSKPLKVVLAQLKDRGERKWLDNHFENISYNDKKACDGAALKGCLDKKPDILIISQIDDSNSSQTISNAVEDALKDGVGVVYIQTPSGEMNTLGKELLNLFEVQYSANNYFKKLELKDYNPSIDLELLDPTVAKIKQLFEHFKKRDFAFDWSKCKDKDGNYDENGDDCKEVEGLDEVYASLDATKSAVDALDEKSIDIFANDGYRLQKLLILMADKIRQNVHFPMDKVASDDNEFFESLYADSAVYNFRKINYTQSDLGNFSSTDFSTVTPTTRAVTLKSKVPFRATGAYALPGQTFKVTREDNSDVVVKVFINTLRASATHEFERGGYKRPKNLESAHIAIKPGESIELTSPYGGPIEVEFSKNEADVKVEFENVGEHPFWASSADNESFAKGLNEGIYNWTEIATESFEVHSRLDKMKESIANPKWDGTAEGLAKAVQKYTANYPYVLAGMKGKGVDEVPEIHNWANERELPIKQVDFVKHMNSDQASCGTGCSGNPYDAYWAFDPIGHGDLHEIGHSLQRRDFDGFPIHGATNTFSYYTKSKYFENTGKDGECQSLPFKEVFDIVKESLSQDDPKAYLQKRLWKNVSWKEPYVLKLNLMMHAQKMGKVEDGWDILARVHIIDRALKEAKLDWENKKESLGFSNYSLDEIESISNNDFLVIAYSLAAGVDFRDFFDMMGIDYSKKASEQIASFNFEKAPKEMMLSTPNGYCKEDKYGRLLGKETIKVEESATYPEE